MADPKKIAFYERYAPMAMEQQQKYGIPASVTLAQMCIESGAGTSRLAVNGNNFFGIKCSRSWLAEGKPYSLHSDDLPNEKFCNYSSVEESVQHHSQLLMGKRYADCRKCASDDYQGWAYGLKAAGYATDSRYATALIADIEEYGLQKFDQQAIADAQAKNLAIGYMRGQDDPVLPQTYTVSKDETPLLAYCFPIAADNLVMTDGFDKSPTSYRDHKHNGIDLRASYQDVFATEHGTVFDTGYQATGGNFVVMEYARADGSKWHVSYCHLDSIDVVKGDILDAGAKLGVSGNTGNSTGPHLHLTVKRQDAGTNEFKTVDPLGYLAEIAVRGSLSGTVLKKGTDEDLLANLKGSVDVTPTPADVQLAQQRGGLTDEQRHNAEKGASLSNALGSNDPKSLLALLMGQNGDTSYSSGGDLFSSLISALFTTAIGLAMQLDRADNDNSQSVASSDLRQQAETEEQRTSTLIKRQRESIDPNKARELAKMNFETDYLEHQEGNNQRLSLG